MPDYERAAVTARRMIADAGRSVLFIPVAGAPADPDKPLHGPADEPEPFGPIPAAFVSVGNATSFGFQINGELAKVATAVCLVAPTEADTNFGAFQFVDDGGARLAIVGVDKLRPGSVTLLWAIVLKSGGAGL